MSRTKRINIDDLSIAELLYLNRQITNRLKWLQTGESSEDIKPFSVGEKVFSHARGFAKMQGKVTHHNDRKGTVISQKKHRKVSPQLLEKVADS